MIAALEPAAVETAPAQKASNPRSIDDLLKTVSPSRLICFLQCRLKFYFRYVLGITKPKTPALHVGTSVHAVLKQWNMARWKQQPKSLKELHDIYLGAWSEQTDAPVKWEAGEEVEQQSIGWKLLETYFRESGIKPDEKPDAVEVSAVADLSRHGLPSLIGILDLVQQGKIIDFKTSGKTPDPEKAVHVNEVQTSSYAVLYRESTGKQEAGIALHHLIKTKSPKLVITQVNPMSPQQQTRLFKIMDSYVNGLNREDFIPSPGFQCSSCEFFNECRGWH